MATDSNIESLILRRLAAVHQKTLAEALGSDETHISRFASGDRGLRIGQIGPALHALGLRLVECTDQTICSDELTALRVLARKALDK